MRNSKVDMHKAGQRLRELRGIRTRTGVARELEIPYSSLQSYEDGAREPAGHIKKKLADYYGVDPDDIFLQTETT